MFGWLILAACGTTWFEQDLDRDGVTVAQGDCWDAVDGPEGSGLAGRDIHPGAAETWYDGVDQDCAGDDDYDADGDGFVPDDRVGLPTLGVPGSGALPGGDCLDLPGSRPAGAVGAVPEAADVHPGAAETWYDGVDQDCSDAGDPTGDFDADGDGFDSADHPAADGSPGTDCDDADPDVHPGAAETWYDGVDQDCSDAGDPTGDFDADGDGFDSDRHTRPDGTLGDDCDDADPGVHPGAAEVCDDADTDEDCDGSANDEGADGCTTLYVDADGDGWGDDALSACLCAPEGLYTATTAGDCLDGGTYLGVAAADVNPGATEVCDDVDDDCDGLVDDDDPDLDPASAGTWYADADGDGWGDPDDTLAACTRPAGTVATAGDCDDADPAINPDATEVCDDADADEDCDGLADDDDPDLDPATTSTWYVDADGDGWGDPDDTLAACDAPSGAVATAGDCDDADAAVNPGAGDADGDGADTDCDGWIDEDLAAAGDLVIVEVMVEPVGAGVQWIEVYNASGRDLALDGWEIAVAAGGLSVCVSVDAALTIAAGDLAVLCASGGDVGGTPCGYDWADNAFTDFSATCPAAAAMTLATADTLSLSVADTLVDAVAWDATFPLRAGRSMELQAAALDATSNDDPASWCAADTGAAYDTGNAGTPGAGPSCP